MKRHFLEINDVDRTALLHLIDKAAEIKKNPSKYSSALKDKTLLMIFAKPSLRTRVSFEVGMTQLGGHGIYYDISTSPFGKGKETISDIAKTSSRYVDLIMARLFEHKEIEELAENSSVPVINALTNSAHPCQILADLQTIYEKKGFKKLTLSYVGDSNNNVTHSLLYGCAMAGINMKIGCPKGKNYEPAGFVVKEAKKLAKNSEIKIFNDASEAVKDADVVYTDSWMSYHIPESKKKERVKIFKPFQVNKALMKNANKDAVFMHCLPAQRGMEVTADVIDGSQSVVYDQAENRLHAQKALMLWLLGKN
jgi:ornithine carbamoyltransferase